MIQIRDIGGRQQAKALFLLVAVLVVATDVTLSAALAFPEVLLDDQDFAASLIASGPVPAALSLGGLVVRGVAMAALSRAVAAVVAGVGRGFPFLGSAAAACWLVSGVLGLVLVPLWAARAGTAVTVLSWIVFGACVFVAPLLVAAWTGILVRRIGRARVLGMLGVCGLLLIAARSAVLALDAVLPVMDRLDVVSMILTVSALLCAPLWICWLVVAGVAMAEPAAAPPRGVGAVVRRFAAAPMVAVVAVAQAGALIVTTPMPDTDRVPAVPSAGAAAFSALMAILSDEFALPADQAQLAGYRQGPRYARPEIPAGATVTHVDAGDVPAEYLCAEGASRDRAVLYLHGGGFVLPMSNGHRAFANWISRETGGCVLLPHYRVAPEHPYPAAVDDSTRAYLWLLARGVPASRTVVLGDSCGGTFALATALALRERGEQLPAALVTLSAGTDLTLSGETHRTKAASDSFLTRDDVEFSARSYLANGAVDPRDPLVSPLFADAGGLPPTLLLAGSPEVLLSDSTRMAERMRAAGVPVRLEVWPGVPHDWPLVAEETVEARLAVRHIVAFIAGASR